MKILRTSGESDCHARDLPSCIFDVSSSPVFERIRRVDLHAPAALQQLEEFAEPEEVEAGLLRTCSGRRAGSGSRAQRPTQPNGK